jgi:predicted NUDIX family NTP pyrophosphohydrolase
MLCPIAGKSHRRTGERPAVVQRSAGVLLYRRRNGDVEVLLVHPGGPYWRNKDVGAWQIPKGLIEDEENTAAAARREASEELGVAVDGKLEPLTRIRQRGGKVVEAFAVEQDLDSEAIISNRFELEWPPKSGTFESFPEVDAARWLTIPAAEAAILPSQRPLLEALRALLDDCG